MRDFAICTLLIIYIVDINDRNDIWCTTNI